jgi:hypothetical protein
MLLSMVICRSNLVVSDEVDTFQPACAAGRAPKIFAVTPPSGRPTTEREPVRQRRSYRSGKSTAFAGGLSMLVLACAADLYK